MSCPETQPGPTSLMGTDPFLRNFFIVQQDLPRTGSVEIVQASIWDLLFRLVTDPFIYVLLCLVET